MYPTYLNEAQSSTKRLDAISSVELTLLSAGKICSKVVSRQVPYIYLFRYSVLPNVRLSWIIRNWQFLRKRKTYGDRRINVSIVSSRSRPPKLFPRTICRTAFPLGWRCYKNSNVPRGNAEEPWTLHWNRIWYTELRTEESWSDEERETDTRRERRRATRLETS